MNGEEESYQEQGVTQPRRLVVWLRKIGWIGFLAFLLKGIIWLVVGYLLLD